MKYNQMSAFEKHLNEASPSHLAEIYLVVDPEEYMQKKWAKRIPPEQHSKEFFEGPLLTTGELHSFLNSPSMFSDEKWGIISRVDQLSKDCMKVLLDYCKNPYPNIRLILTSNTFIADFKKIEKLVVTLDVSYEKPWLKEERLNAYLQKALKKEGKDISKALADQFIKKTGLKEAIIDQEIEKFVCYLKNRNEVMRSDLSLIRENFVYSIFKIGECILKNNLDKALSSAHELKHPFIPLLYALRTLFQRYYRMKELPLASWTQAFPQLKGNLLEKNADIIRKHSKDSFKRALFVIYEMEILAKNQSIPDEFLSSLLLLKLGLIYESLSV